MLRFITHGMHQPFAGTDPRPVRLATFVYDDAASTRTLIIIMTTTKGEE